MRARRDVSRGPQGVARCRLPRAGLTRAGAAQDEFPDVQVEGNVDGVNPRCAKGRSCEAALSAALSWPWRCAERVSRAARHSKGAFEVTTDDGRIVFSKLKARAGLRAAARARRQSPPRLRTSRVCAAAQMRRDPRAAEVVASIRTLIPGVGAPVEGFGGCA